MCTDTWGSWLWMQGEHVLLMALPVIIVIMYYRYRDRAPRPARTRLGARLRRVLDRVGPVHRNGLS